MLAAKERSFERNNILSSSIKFEVEVEKALKVWLFHQLLLLFPTQETDRLHKIAIKFKREQVKLNKVK
jgi:hypothetical protein